MKSFRNLIGQTKAVESVTESILSVRNGGPVTSYFFDAPAGVGKTTLAIAYLAEMEDHTNIAHFDGSELSDYTSERFAEFTTLVNSGRYLVFIDEWQDLGKNKGGCIVKKFVKACTDGRRSVGNHSIPFGDDSEVDWNTSHCGFVIGTNFPDSIEDATRTRLFRLCLPTYSAEEMAAIATLRLKEAGLTANESSLLTFGKASRGIARTAEYMRNQIVRHFTANEITKRTVNKEDICKALQALEIYLLGFDRVQVELLASFKTATLSRVAKAQFARMGDGFKDAISLFLSKGLIGNAGSTAYILTEKGRRYFAESKELKFDVPSI